MKKSWQLGMGVAALIASGPAMASDHADGTTTPITAALGNPATDITDVYAWMSSDTTATAGTAYLIMNVYPGASASSLFSTSAKYVFHTSSEVSILATPAAKRDIVCTFAGTTAPQTASCWLTDGAGTTIDYVTGNATDSTIPIGATDGKLKVFAGPRNDPFFFNLVGFRNATSVVANALAAFTASPSNTTYITSIDTNGCPTISTTASLAAPAGPRQTIVNYLKNDCTGAAAGKDFFRKPETDAATGCGVAPSLVTTAQTTNEGLTGTVLTLAISVDKTLLTSGGSTLSVWGATTN